MFNRYQQKPDDLELISLAEFAVRHETVSNTFWDNDNGDIELRDQVNESTKYIRLRDNTRKRIRNQAVAEGCFLRRQSELRPLLRNLSLEQFAYAEQVNQQALVQAVALTIVNQDKPRANDAGFRARWNSSTKNGTDLRLGIRTLLIIARLTVDKKTVQRRWFPRTVELFDEERHRLETWHTGAAYHRSTDRGQENGAAAWFPSTVELFDEERHRLQTWHTGAAYHRSTDRGQENGAAALVSEHSGTLRRRTAQT
ncbi:hypothetical protein EVAR_616_1 [Eumeta japonica]|uniref:Uncharacterized protein n=1 Tax=Eumeta variegata TaxID=151549 RepID=A0A4C1SDD8_EUMVA|nr:hypothetical protein EVAR_616_1 [Eumeta japonica]